VPRRRGGREQVAGADGPGLVGVDVAPDAPGQGDRQLAVGVRSLLRERQARVDAFGAADHAGDLGVVRRVADAQLAQALGVDAHDHARLGLHDAGDVERLGEVGAAHDLDDVRLDPPGDMERGRRVVNADADAVRLDQAGDVEGGGRGTVADADLGRPDLALDVQGL